MSTQERIENLTHAFGITGKIAIQCANEFEPHGRASETFEIIWRITLPTPHHWKNNTGKWVRGKTASPIEFKGRTLDSVIVQAEAFVRECPEAIKLSTEVAA